MQISEPAEYVILGLLKSRPMHGYDMFQYFEGGTLGQIIHLEMSQMYAFLKKLERLHYIEAEVELQGSRPPRKIFHLTTTGHTIFMDWLVQADEKPRDIRILFLIKLYFVQRFLPAQTSELIKQQIQACEHFLVHLRTKQHSTPATAGEVEDTTFFDQIVMNSRIHQTTSLLEWLFDLQRELAGIH